MWFMPIITWLLQQPVVHSCKMVSETLSKKLNKKVVIAAGIHWDNIPEAGIEQVIKNSRTLVQLILDLFGEGV